MRHVEGQIELARSADATIPVWLSNGGLNKVKAAQSYDDTAQILRDVAGEANVVVDAKELAERRFRTSRLDPEREHRSNR
jgi:hypothetical protein